MTKANPYPETHRYAANRLQYRQKLALDWVRLHRPDIADLIDDAVAKRYPYRITRKPAEPLPDTLRKAK